MARRVKQRNKTPLIVICSESGKNNAENTYFNNFKNRNCRTKFATGNSTDVSGMLDDLINYMNKENINNETEDELNIYLVLDTDLSDDRISEIIDIENKCDTNKIEIITSSPTFEIWYLMHYRSNNLKFKDSNEVKKELRKIIPEYKESINIYDKISANTKEAIKNAKSVEKQFKEKDKYSFTPHSYVYKIIEKIEYIKENFNRKSK